MKNYLFLLFLLVTTYSFAQNNSIRFGVEAGIGVSDFIYTSNSEVPNSVVDLWKKEEQIGLAFRIGGTATIPKEKIDWQTGLLVESTASRIEQEDLLWGTEINPDGQVEAEEERIESITFSERYNFIQVPLRLIWKTGKLRPVLGLSPQFFFLFRQKTIRKYEDRESIDISLDFPARKNIANLNLELGFQYNLLEKNGQNLYIFPRFTVQTFGLARQVNLNRRVWTGQCSLGWQF